MNGCIADYRELVQQICDFAATEFPVGDIIVLFEALDRRFVAPGNAHGAIAHDAFGVAHVSEDFLNAPLAGSVAKIALLLRERAQESSSVVDLVLKCGDDVVCANERNVALIIRIIFCGRGTADAGGECAHRTPLGRQIPRRFDPTQSILARSKAPRERGGMWEEITQGGKRLLGSRSQSRCVEVRGTKENPTKSWISTAHSRVIGSRIDLATEMRRWRSIPYYRKGF